MTIAKQLEAKCYQLGRQDGVNEGKQEATRQLAKQLLSDGIAREYPDLLANY